MVRTRSHLSALSLVALAAAASACGPEAPPVTPPPRAAAARGHCERERGQARGEGAEGAGSSVREPRRDVDARAAPRAGPPRSSRSASRSIRPRSRSRRRRSSAPSSASVGARPPSSPTRAWSSPTTTARPAPSSSTPPRRRTSSSTATSPRRAPTSAGPEPTARVFVTQSSRDVTKEVRDGVAKIKSDKDRHDKIEEHTKALVTACEKDRPGLRCTVSEVLRRPAVPADRAARKSGRAPRLRPHAGVGNYGGEIDNWR